MYNWACSKEDSGSWGRSDGILSLYSKGNERGWIGIFNRSYYEDVLVVKVHPELLAAQKLPLGKRGKAFWQARYEDINAKWATRAIVADILATAMLGLDLRYPEVTEAQHQALEQARRQLAAE